MRENEQSWVATGGILGRLWYGHLSHESEGHPGAVDFPFAWVNHREESKGDIVGFCHTHPGMTASPSMRDYATMQAWVASFGKPLMCLIEGVDGLKAYLYFDDESPCIRCKTVKRFGQLVVVIMPQKRLYDKPAVLLNELPLEEYLVLDGPDIPEIDDGPDLDLTDFDDDIVDHTLDWDEYDHCDG